MNLIFCHKCHLHQDRVIDMRSSKSYKKRSSYFTRKSRKSYRRGYRTSKRIKPSQGYGTLVNKCNTTMPAKFITRHTYNTPVVFSVTGAAVTPQVFRGNSLYDPDQTGVGTTASGYTPMTTWYSYFRVYASSIEFTVANTGSYPVIYFCVPSRTSAAISITDAKSLPYYKEVIVAAKDGGSSVRKLKVFAKGVTITGVNQTDFDVIGAVGSNPQQQWYWVTGAVSADGINASSVSVSNRITYFTEWSGLKPYNS